MIQPPRWSGVAFSERSDGDVRNDEESREGVSRHLGIQGEWAEVTQVHGAAVVRVLGPGAAGEADALWTSEGGLPLAVFTADCFGVVLSGDHSVGVAHAGWRGAAARVVAKLRTAMIESGHPPLRAAIGPGIGPCCFEVGPEVAELFADISTTMWGSTSVDLASDLSTQLTGLEVWNAESCTFHEEGWFSHRSEGTSRRLATIGWVP